MKEIGIDPGLADQLFDGLLEVDTNGRITLWNRGLQRMTGYAASHAIGKPLQQGPAKHVSEAGIDLPDIQVPILMTLQDGRPREGFVYLNHADGYRLTSISRTMAVLDRRRKIVGALEVLSDNKALMATFQAMQRTEETVLFDPLTGIGNRPHIEMKIRTAIQEFRVHERVFGVLFIDIDHFKAFNDTFGHLIGDKILRVAANTLRQNLRASDSCGRWGGEEFIALVRDLDTAGLKKVAEKLRQSVAETKIAEEDHELGITISIGASLARPEDTYQSLLERVDQLMYESKRLGRNRVTIEC